MRSKLSYAHFFIVIIIFLLISFLLHWDFTYKLCLIYLLYLLSVAVHETGHMLFGYLIGMDLLKLYVGPIKLHKVNGKIKLNINNNFELSNGLCLMFMDSELFFKNRFLAHHYFGGVYLNALIAGILILIIQFFPQNSDEFVKLFGLFNFVIALATLLPFEGNDGFAGWKLLQNDSKYKNKLWLQNIYASPKLVKDFNESEINLLQIIHKKSEEINELFSSSILLELNYLYLKEYQEVLYYLTTTFTKLEKEEKDKHLSCQYQEVIEFQLSLLQIIIGKESGKLIINQSEEVLNRALQYYKICEDERIREYIKEIFVYPKSQNKII